MQRSLTGKMSTLVVASLLFLGPAFSRAQDSRPASGGTSTPGATAGEASTPGTTAGASGATSRPAVTSDGRELKAEVPELTAFHEVIFRLWHDAWPNKNAKQVRDLLPQVKKDFAAIGNAVLPGILRDRKDAWTAGLTRLKETVAALDNAARGKDDQALFDAVEALHSAFEAQMRVVRPHMKELEDYHVFLYQIFHRFHPERAIDPLAVAADSLDARCGVLQNVEPPRWFSGDRDQLKAEIGILCTRTTELRAALTTKEWEKIDPAVQAVHSQYQKIEGMFE